MPNALASERSPYLRQHQLNPVDWMPWGEPALRRAQELKRPILLSIGYSACHWCHVMARESFENVETAALMNEWFVNIKVDREERPDIDAIHIRALQAMGRRAGWPLTIFLTPDGNPFWGGTYFPPEERDDLPAFRDVLKWVNDTYHSDPESVAQKGAQFVDELISGSRQTQEGVDLTHNMISSVAEDLLAHVDQANGGLLGAPKFPYPSLFRFLWNQGARDKRADFRCAVIRTLDGMAKGGIFDHVGGGFFRYSVDASWQVPHFEKMLYDNAQLLSLFSEAYRATRNSYYRYAVKRTAEWLIREMTVAGGAFACSLDAESEGKEGAYYLLTADGLDRALGDDAARFFERYFKGSADFADGKVLNRLSGHATEGDHTTFARYCDQLLRARVHKGRPRRDDKVLADWNGLAILGLTEASVVFEEPAWLSAAETAFRFVVQNLAPDGMLRHSWNEGVAGSAAILDDYANMALAALKLHEITGDPSFIARAIEWANYCVDHFRDGRGTYYYTPDYTSLLVARICETEDTATPSGNGVVARALALLYYRTGDSRFFERAQALFRAFAGEVGRSGFLLASVLDAQQFLSQVTQVTIIGDTSDPLTRQLRECAHRHAPVDRAISVMPQGKELHRNHPAFGKAAAGFPAAFVCAGSTCSLPLSDPNALKQLLES